MIYLSDVEELIDEKVENYIEEEFSEYSEEDPEYSYIQKALERYLRYCINDWVFDGEVKWGFDETLKSFRETRHYKKIKEDK